jgi:hypothetical protein
MGSPGAPRFFFVHVMKTGGTSFVFQLSANFAPAEVYPNEILDRRAPTDLEPYASLADLERLSPQRRAQIRVFTGHLPFAARELIGPDVVTLTLLRDPVERTISVLKHFKRLYARYRDLPLDAIYDDEIVYRRRPGDGRPDRARRLASGSLRRSAGTRSRRRRSRRAGDRDSGRTDA